MAVKVKQHKGQWWLFIDHKGKRKAKAVGSKQAAETAAKKIEARLTLGDYSLLDEKPQRPFDTYFQGWLDTYVKAHCKERTYDLYADNFRLYLSPAFKQRDIGEIRRDEIKRLAYGLLASGKRWETVRLVLSPLSEMFNHAIEDGHLMFNPAARILKKSRVAEGEKQKADFLSKEEAGTLLRGAQEYVPTLYPLVSLLVRTGLRLGEAFGLQWEDLDFQSRFIEVRRTLSDGRLTSPKSGKSRRVDMSQHLTDMLRGVLVERKKDTLRHGWGEVPPWVFLSSVGTPLQRREVVRQWTRLLSRVGMRHLRLHDLRHTFASLLIQNGESLAYIKEQMGHHSIKITVDTYGHLIPGGNKAAVDRLDGLENETIRNPGATSVETTFPRKTGST